MHCLRQKTRALQKSVGRAGYYLPAARDGACSAVSSAGVADPRGDVKGSAWRQPVYKENYETSPGADVGSGGADGDVLQQDNLRSRGALRVYGCMFAAASSALTGEERASGKEWNRIRQALDRWSGTAVFKVGGRSPQGVLGGTGGAKSWREYKKIICE